MRKLKKSLCKVISLMSVVMLCQNAIPVYSTYAADKKDNTLTTASETTQDETTEWNSPGLLIDKYSVTEGKIIPGRPFTLTLQIKNYGGADADNLILNVSNPKGVSPVYGTVSQIYIGDIKSGETKEVKIDYDSYTSITSDYLDFVVGVASLTYSNYVNMSIPVSTDSPFSISSVNGPENVFTNQKSTYSVTFKVIGNDNVSGVSVILSVDGQVVGENNIGILTPGTTKTQNISTQFDTPGEYHVEQVITYVDGNGVTQMMLAKSTQVLVSESETVIVTPTPQPNGTTDQNKNESVLGSKAYVLVLSGAMLLVLLIMVVILVKKKK